MRSKPDRQTDTHSTDTQQWTEHGNSNVTNHQLTTNHSLWQTA